jgi:hypothetical protein
MANAKPELAQEAIRLRIEERRSLREIAEITGASKGSLSGWLKSYPLTQEERTARQKMARRYITPKKDRGEVSKFFHAVAGRGLTRLEKAKIAESAVAFRLLLHGFHLYGSMFDGDKADWVVQAPGTKKIYTIQVRWVGLGGHGLPFINLKCTEGHHAQRRYAEGEFDFIVGYDLYSDTAFVYSAAEIAHLKATVTICSTHAERWDKLYAEQESAE